MILVKAQRDVFSFLVFSFLKQFSKCSKQMQMLPLSRSFHKNNWRRQKPAQDIATDHPHQNAKRGLFVP